MSEDERLAALFREAAGDPPPGFDHDTVVTRSRRVTARRRTALLGSAGALVVVLGTGIVVGGQARDESASTAAAPAAGGEAEAGPEGGSAERGGADTALGETFDARPVDPAPEVPGPPEPGTPGVDRQDPELRALLERALPQVVGAPEAPVAGAFRPDGAREVTLQVVDGTAFGRLTVVALPPGEPSLQPQEAAVATAPTASGGTVVVLSEGDGPGAPAPFAGRLDAVAAALAPAL